MLYLLARVCEAYFCSKREEVETLAAYSYIAIASDGKEKKGAMEASDETKVRSQLRNEGLIPIKVTPQSALTKDVNISFGSAVKPRDLSIFCRQFTSILNAGVTAVNALDMLGAQTENKVFKKAIIETRQSVEKGETLADALRLNSKIFPPILINIVEAGESSGSLDHAFERMSTHFEKEAKLKSLIKKAMIYPSMLIIVAFVVVIVMSVFVVPQFMSMFEDLGTELPVATKIVMAISDFFRKQWYMAILIALTLIGIIRGALMTERGKLLIGKLKIKIPIFGKMEVKSASANFARTMSTLVSAGLSVTESLEITSRSMSNILFRDALLQAKEEAERGVPISEPLKKSNLFPPMVYHMLKIGEETGNMEGMLNKIAEYYEEEVEIQTQSLTTALEPMIIIIMAVIVGFIVLAIYQPMIGMYAGLENL